VARESRLSEAQRFSLRFFLILAGFSVLSYLIQLPSQLGLVQRWLARSASSIARLAGSESWVEEDQVRLGPLTLDINFECTGVYVLMILITFLLAYPASWRDRLGGAALGIGGLTAVNVFRLSFLIRVGEMQPALFAYFHEYVWQGLFLVLVIVYAMSWAERVR
jgi:exosortase/archaeosortase family protein